MNGVKTFVTFVKKETAFCIAGLLAVVSIVFTPRQQTIFIILITACCHCFSVLWQ